MNQFLTFLQDNWGPILLALIVVLFIFRNKISKMFKRKKKEVVEEKAVNFNDMLFGENTEQLLGNLHAQKKKAEREIQNIQQEGKKLVAEEKSTEVEYSKKRRQIAMRKDELGFKHTTWMNQLNMTNQMIDNQEAMKKKFQNE